MKLKYYKKTFFSTFIILSSRFPTSDLIIGKISGVYKKESELFQEADIEPIIDYRNLSIISVILPIND